MFEIPETPSPVDSVLERPNDQPHPDNPSNGTDHRQTNAPEQNPTPLGSKPEPYRDPAEVPDAVGSSNVKSTCRKEKFITPPDQRSAVAKQYRKVYEQLVKHICEDALVDPSDYHKWKRNKLPDDSALSERIEAVLHSVPRSRSSE
jgi:hypothetical protein